MKRVLTLILALAMAMSLIACGAKEEPAPAPEKEETKTETPAPADPAPADPVEMTEHYKLAWIMPDMFNPFWTYMRQGAEKAAQEYAAQGIKVDIQQMAPINTFNVAEQVAIFENAIEMGVDGIGICVIDQNSVIEQVNKGAAKGIPTVALSTDIPDSDRMSYSGFVEWEWAYEVADYVIQQNGGKGNYIILEGLVGNYNSDQRTKGYTEAINKYPDCKLLEVQPANFSRSEGMSLMENLMVKYGKGEIQGVFTVNDEVAMGALEAMEAVGRADEILIGSVDGALETCNAIADGRVCATFNSNPWEQGYVSVKALVEKAQGKDVPDILDVTPYVVTAENVDDTLAVFPEWAKYYKE